ncbi:unnamed protein product [Macrosiphum euphorbiae]|uniref:Gag protein n=1 Tax=Macrosiphum euphorbiae TaxID=13131 RepID=A0AAV0XT86_9HEMI|nr:unnamed protein product [Macrosiphum euphorbiae]
MQGKIPLDKATLMIPTCTGERDLYQFIKACDLACSAEEREDLPILTKFINTKLFGQALNVCRYRDTSDWEGIKLILLDAFEPQQSKSSLQVALNSVRSNEDVGAYARRVEQLYFNLCVASTKGKTTEQANTIRDQLKEQTLVVFIKGLIPSLKTIVKSQKPPTLELAIQVAKDEETEIKSESDAYQYYGGNSSGRQVNNSTRDTNNSNRRNNNFNNRYNYNSSNNNRPNHSNDNSQRQNYNPRDSNYIRPQYNRNPNFNRPDINQGNRNNFNNNQYQPRNNNNFNRNNDYNRSSNYRNNNNAIGNIRCYQCGGNHFARDCVQHRNSNNSRPSNNNFTRQPTNYNAPVDVICTYCKKSGHDVTKCFRKQNNDRYNNNSGNLPRSGDMSGARPINLIVTVEEDFDNAYTSYQS